MSGSSSGHMPQIRGQDRPTFPLLCVFFAEFDNTVGPKIYCQAPEGFLSDELFDSISDFIITGPELCHKLVTLSAFDYVILGYPVSLSSNKYHRNQLLFNVGFVFPRDLSKWAREQERQKRGAGGGGGGSQHQQSPSHSSPQPSPTSPSSDSASTSNQLPNSASNFSSSSSPPHSLSSTPTSTLLRPYHPVLRKLARMIESLEMESEFLFRTESKTKLLHNLIQQIYTNLNNYGECSILVDASLAAATSGNNDHDASGASNGGIKMKTRGRRKNGQTRLLRRRMRLMSGTDEEDDEEEEMMMEEVEDESSSEEEDENDSPLSTGSSLTSPRSATSHNDPSSPTGMDTNGTPHASSSSTTTTTTGMNPDFESGIHKVHLKLYPLLSPPPKIIPGYLVPLRTKDLDELSKVEWDLTLRQVIPFLDGVNYVNKIATLSGIHLSLVSKCIRQLIYYEAVQLVDIFQYSNRYTSTELLGKSVADLPTMQQEERERSRKLRKDMRSYCRLDASSPKPPFYILMKLLTSFNQNVTIGEVFKSMPTWTSFPPPPPPPAPTPNTANTGTWSLESANINPRRLVQFAVVNGLIRRVYCYPVLTTLYAPTQAHINMSHSSSPTHPSSATRTFAATSSPSPSPPPPLVPLTALHPPSSYAYHSHSHSGIDLSYFGLIHGRQQRLEEMVARMATNANANMKSATKMPTTKNAGQVDPNSNHSSPTKIHASSNPATAQARSSRRSKNDSIGYDPSSHATNDRLRAPSSSSSPPVSTGAPGTLLSSLSSNTATSAATTGAMSMPAATTSVGGATTGLPSSASSSSSSMSLFRSMERYLDGCHHFDQLCCIFNRSQAVLEEEVRKSKRCVILTK